MEKKEKSKKDIEKTENLVCGIVMPISEIDGLSETHWAEVLNLLEDSITGAGFEPNLVSNSEDIGVIQKKIVQNLYENPIVVCDVSAKNPNVMFELGMRLAFDKPTIIIKDDNTSYSFDTSPIEHLEYPRDLRYPSMVEFKRKLTSKIKKTYEKSNADKNYSTFLGNFGTFKTAKIETEVVGKEDLILDEIKNFKNIFYSQLNNHFEKFNSSTNNNSYVTYELNVTLTKQTGLSFKRKLLSLKFIDEVEFLDKEGDRFTFRILTNRSYSTKFKINELTTFLSKNTLDYSYKIYTEPTRVRL